MDLRRAFYVVAAVGSEFLDEGGAIVPDKTAAVQIAALEATVTAKFDAFDRRAESQESTHRETAEAIDRLASVTHSGFSDLGRDLATAVEKSRGQAGKIRDLETARETDRRAGITAGAGTGISAAALLELLLHFFGFGGRS